MQTRFHNSASFEIAFQATRQPRSSKLGTYVRLRIGAYPIITTALMHINDAIALRAELDAAIAAAEALQAGVEVVE